MSLKNKSNPIVDPSNIGMVHWQSVYKACVGSVWEQPSRLPVREVAGNTTDVVQREAASCLCERQCQWCLAIVLARLYKRDKCDYFAIQPRSELMYGCNMTTSELSMGIHASVTV